MHDGAGDDTVSLEQTSDTEEEADDGETDDDGRYAQDIITSVSEAFFPGSGAKVNQWIEDHRKPQSMGPLGTVTQTNLPAVTKTDQSDHEPEVTNTDTTKRQIVAVLDSNVHRSKNPTSGIKLEHAKNPTSGINGVSNHVSVIHVVEPDQDMYGGIKFDGANALQISSINALQPDTFLTQKLKKKTLVGAKKLQGRPFLSTNAATWNILTHYVRTGKWLQEEMEGVKFSKYMVYHYVHHPKMPLARAFIRAEKRGDDHECNNIRAKAIRNNVGTKTRRNKNSRQTKKARTN